MLAVKGKRGVVPTEADEQRVLASYLDHLHLLRFHCPNEARRSPQLGRRLKQLGLRAGVADCLIFDPPPAKPHCRGVALELKRQHGGRLSKAQEEWLDEIRKRGWYAVVCHGADDAIRTMRCLGYEERRHECAG